MHMKKVFKLFFSLALFILVCNQSTKAKEPKFINISARRLYSHLAKYLGKRQKREWEKFKGKIVRWEAKLPPHYGSFSLLWGITEKGFKTMLLCDGIRVVAYFPEKEAEKFYKLSEYDRVIFEGILEDFNPPLSFKEYYFLLKKCKLIKIIKAKPASISILECKFSYRKTFTPGVDTLELGKWVEITSCSVLLANKGEIPAKNYILEIEIGNVKGIQKSLEVIPAGGSVENTIFLFGEWYQNNKKLSLGEFPKLKKGIYKVSVRIKNKENKILTSKNFKCSFLIKKEGEIKCLPLK